jgi:hypothetical protein
VPFRSDGKINKLTFKFGSVQLTEDDRKIMHTGTIISLTAGRRIPEES